MRSLDRAAWRRAGKVLFMLACVALIVALAAMFNGCSSLPKPVDCWRQNAHNDALGRHWCERKCADGKTTWLNEGVCAP
jgi:starvation-inducible outer membrane lipoprotein